MKEQPERYAPGMGQAFEAAFTLLHKEPAATASC